MHECPECGQACYCNGDIDDCSVMSDEWVYMNCDCCEGDDAHDDWGADDEY